VHRTRVRAAKCDWTEPKYQSSSECATEYAPVHLDHDTTLEIRDHDCRPSTDVWTEFFVVRVHATAAVCCKITGNGSLV
jgi:hypothetical protein